MYFQGGQSVKQQKFIIVTKPVSLIIGKQKTIKDTMLGREQGNKAMTEV